MEKSWQSKAAAEESWGTKALAEQLWQNSCGRTAVAEQLWFLLGVKARSMFWKFSPRAQKASKHNDLDIESLCLGTTRQN